MKFFLILIILCSTFSFGQYISKATLVLTDGKVIEVRDLIYTENGYDFKNENDVLSIQTINKEYVSKIEYDSFYFSKDSHKFKETYVTHNLSDGVYETIEDFYNGTPTSTEEIIGREDGEKVYNFPKDLMLFKNLKKEIIKNPFAIVYQGDLFFNIKKLNKIESKEMKALYSNSEAINRYVRVKYMDNDYYYTEIYQKKSNDGAVIASMLFGVIGAAVSSAIEPKNLESDVFPIILLNQDKKVYQVNDCLTFNRILTDKINIKLPCRKKEDNSIQNVRRNLIKNI
ncbi:hypothetical protein [Empedobacter brevis]|uniref:hypothetical protein n=1 Tax=Empedobacter brevis TaxID=247 RepID=UPI00289E60B1|nr:hypothetical protein [Empedobacter brevis]